MDDSDATTVAFRCYAGYVDRVSYYTKVTLVSPEPKTVELAPLRPAIEAKLDALGVSRDVIPDIETLFTAGKSTIKVYPFHVEALMKLVSEQRPDTRFVTRVKGEDEKEVAAWAFEKGARSLAKEDPKLSEEAREALTTLQRDPPAEPYSARTRFAAGAVLQHPSFGKGVVLSSQPTKIVVQFSDVERTLVHGRPA